MVRALAVEYSIQADPDAKEMGRCIIQDKMNSILPPEIKETIRKFNVMIKESLSSSQHSKDVEFAKLAYQVSKIMRIDNVI
jgi:hypothetical protein